MNITQLSVFMENKPGHLEKILRVLYENDINIMALTIAETEDYGILRMIVKNPNKAQQVLHDEKILCKTTDVLAIELEDKPGALYKATQTLQRHNINIEYMYAFTEKHENKGLMIFRFNDIEKAKKALDEEGYVTVKRIDIIEE